MRPLTWRRITKEKNVRYFWKGTSSVPSSTFFSAVWMACPLVKVNRASSEIMSFMDDASAQGAVPDTDSYLADGHHVCRIVTQVSDF